MSRESTRKRANPFHLIRVIREIRGDYSPLKRGHTIRHPVGSQLKTKEERPLRGHNSGMAQR
jgi:hypothetical protein